MIFYEKCTEKSEVKRNRNTE